MSSLINLATAILLAVSPILSEPKQVERPDNVLYEQVNYFENNIKTTSYISYNTDFNSYTYYLDITDNKLIDFYIELCSLEHERNVYVYMDGYELVTYEGSFNDSDFEIFQSGYDSFDNIVSIDFDNADNSLNFNYVFPFFDEGDHVVYEAQWTYTLEVSEEYFDYYSYDDYKVILDLNLLNLSVFNVYLDRYYLNLEGPGIIDNTFGIVGNTIQEYVSVVVGLFSQVVALFYAEGKLTILGVLMVFAFGIGVVKFGFNMMKTLLRL